MDAPTRKQPAYSGATHHAWKGEEASVKSGRERAGHRFALGPCQECGAPGIDRHHRDGNTLNNAPGNIVILCRRCHMAEDGRLAALIQAGKRSKEQPPKPCANCGHAAKPLRKGRCEPCAWWVRNRGRERPASHWHSHRGPVPERRAA